MHRVTEEVVSVANECTAKGFLCQGIVSGHRYDTSDDSINSLI